MHLAWARAAESFSLTPLCLRRDSLRLTGNASADIAEGESVIKYKSPLNVLKDTYDYSCCLARSYEYNHLMTDSPGARVAVEQARGLVGLGAGVGRIAASDVEAPALVLNLVWSGGAVVRDATAPVLRLFFKLGNSYLVTFFNIEICTCGFIEPPHLPFSYTVCPASFVCPTGASADQRPLLTE